MIAELLSVGTELLLGDILNTNARDLSCELAKLGVSVFNQTVVGDNSERLLSAYESAFNRNTDIVITTGGLGPTEDDLTKEVAAKYFNKQLYLHEDSLNWIYNYLNTQGLVMTENNKKQALMPEGATVLPNDKGTAPGCIIEDDGKIIINLPGPPQEMIHMFKNYVEPFLKEKQQNCIISRVIKLCGIGESKVEELLNDLMQSENPSVAPYAKTCEVHLRLTASGESEQQAYSLIEPIANEIYSRLSENIYGENDSTLEGAVVGLLTKHNLTIATAESCTGGLLCGRIVDFAGASKALKEGCITYSNEAKINRLGVSPQTLEQFGAVSHEVAMEMAKGIAETSVSNVGISTTGIAGPDGGTDEKPVGLVYIGLYINGELLTKEYKIIGDRQRVRQRTVVYALDWLRRELIARF